MRLPTFYRHFLSRVQVNKSNIVKELKADRRWLYETVFCLKYSYIEDCNPSLRIGTGCFSSISVTGMKSDIYRSVQEQVLIWVSIKA